MKTVYCASAKMKYFGATALFTLAILTECLGAQSDRSRSRSSPVRRAPVAADIKRDVDFDCPEEFGYYPHPTDCTLYYVCVFGGALLESCTGGLMYSHELQTCDWPRNVGCDGTFAVRGEDLERLSEREPPPPPPPRRAPPPPPRAQPNPVVTSRGQPKFNRQEYEKQQQLYAEVEDDLPPIEELESDRQQRVYRGQPGTIGQVQKDRDGYASQQISSGRTLNSNIIPASLPQSSKIGSFSFGSQVDDRRTASVTPAPQAYSEDKSDIVTDSHHDRLDIVTNEIKTDDVIKKHSRRKREIVGKDLGEIETSSAKPEEISKRSDSGEEMEYIEFMANDTKEENAQDDTERGKRQVRYYLKNGYKSPGKNWALAKPAKIVEYQQPNYNPNVNSRYQQAYNNLNNNNYYEASRPQSALNNNYYSTANPFLKYQVENTAPRGYFKPSLPDNSGEQVAHNSHNTATRIITKSPPISSLSGENENLFTSLAGGFINNDPKASNVQYFNQFSSTTSRPKDLISFPDSSQLPSTIVTAKPVPRPSSPQTQEQYQKPKSNINGYHAQVTQNPTRNSNKNQKVQHQPTRGRDYEEETSSREEDSSEEDEDEENEDDYRYPEFKFPTNKYKDVVNPFANPDFDFDAYLSKFSYSPYSSGSSENEPRPSSAPKRNPTVKPTAQSTTASHLEYRSPSPNPVDIRPSSATIIPKVKASTDSHFVHRLPSQSQSPTATYNAMSTPKPFTVSSRHGTSAIPVVSSVRPSFAPIKQVQQYEQAFQNPEPTGQILQQQLHLQEQQQQQNLHQRHQQHKQQQELQKQEQQQYQHQQQYPQQHQYQHQQQHYQQQQHQQQQQQQYEPLNENVFKPSQSTASIPLDAVRPKLKPPNFKDDRQLPISYSFIRPIESSQPPTPDNKPNIQQVISVTGKPYYLISGTAAPGVVVSTPKQQYIVNSDNVISLSPHTGKPYLISSVKPQDVYSAIKLSTAKPLTTLAQEQLSALQQYWNSPTTGLPPLKSVTIKPSTSPKTLKLENLFAHVKSTQVPVKNYNNFVSVSSSAKPIALITTTKPSLKRRPIPKPSPEMNDYYYDDDEEYYDEPEVKPKYMPSTEIKPQRPPMAQNDEEYDDSYEDDDDDESEQVVHVKPSQPTRIPVGFSTRRPESATKNHNDVSIVTKLPLKDFTKNINGKIPVPVLVDYASPTPTVLIRPESPNIGIVPHNPINKTHIRKPIIENGPNTVRPPKYLNQTTLRPYTVRHRLAKPTTVKEPHDEDKKTRGIVRHQNLVAQILSTTPRDSYNQETRFTKTNHDDKTNSLEPTESVAPVSYSASPRPKMLYNASQSYSPDQYDPFYAVYDEDGELYKDTDYVQQYQQYNTASLRPAVQQTYRGTPPPVRRPVETYTPRPSADDYDDELIQPQISNQNQYQAPIRHSTRGEGNELGYEHNPSSVKTTLYEATTIRTTPRTTTSTSTTTTQRPTTAPYTEAMTPRYTPRSSTDESPIPESSSTKPSDETSSSIPSTPPPVINVSSLAKPFEKTDNSHRLGETIATTEKLLTARRSSQVTNNNKLSLEVGRSKSNGNNKKVVSLTSGFSIRRDPNNTNNPYTLTVLTRPFDDYDKPRRASSRENNNRRAHSDRYYYDSGSSEAPVETKSSYEKSTERSTRRKSYTPVMIEDDDIPIFVRPTSRTRTVKPRIKTTTISSSTILTTSTTESYYIQASKRPTAFSVNKADIVGSTENSINSEAFIDSGIHNAHSADIDEESTRSENYRSDNSYTDSAPVISPYKTLGNIRNAYKKDGAFYDITTPSTSTTRYTMATAKPTRIRNTKKQKISRTKPSYYSYRIDDDIVPDQTTEVFNEKVKNVIKTFFTNLVTTPIPEVPIEAFTTTTIKPTTPIQKIEDEIVNIGYQKKPFKYVDEKPLRSYVKRLQIITEPTVDLHVTPKVDTINYTEKDILAKDLSSTSTTMATMSSSPYAYASLPTTPLTAQSSTNDFRNVPVKESHQSKFSSLIKSKPDSETTQKFEKIINDVPSTEYKDNLNIETIKPTQTDMDDTKTATDNAKLIPSTVENEIASTTSTTKSTTTLKILPTTSTTKSISFPPRASRVNPAIKLAATNPGSGRRSYQTSSKCSSDNSLQANPKCNEIKYQRPTSTRGRGSAHYSNSGGSDQAPAQPAPNRGTPPTRSRPTLKPSTAIVSKTTEFVDIYANPPSRPAPVYPQPTPDKTAAKCRKDVCQLPDCYCGGKDIPGEMPVDQVPQIVLLTFDDSVNDLNKGLYADLFEKGRVNPNGCPISATFYVSHEWTDYSQVQNLYSAGHEMASHTVSHSFGEQFSQKKWNREVSGQREILAAYGGVKLEDVRGMRAPFLSVGGNKMFKMLYDSNFTYDSSLPVYENKPPSWPYTLDYKLFHDCMIPPCPTKSYPGVWEVPMVMWQDLNGGRCSMGDACANPPEAENVYKMILKNFDRHYTTNRAPFGLFYHAAWFTQPHHKEGFIMFLDFINQMQDVWIVTNWQALQWVRDPTPISRMNNFQPFQCNYQDRPKKCNNPKVCNLWHKSGVRYMRTCQPCPEIYPWTGKSGISSSRIDNDKGE